MLMDAVAMNRPAAPPIPLAPEGAAHAQLRRGDYVVSASELIETPEQARSYYRAKLERKHAIAAGGEPISIVFERGATHLYSEKVPDPDTIQVDQRVTRIISGSRREEVREFNLGRARLMDQILPAISLFTVATPGTGSDGREKCLIYGPQLPSKDYLRVVLRPGPGTACTCVSAYTVNVEIWLAARREKRAKFPP